MIQDIFLVGIEKARVHRAVRLGSRGYRGINTYGRCQIYPLFLDRYMLLSDLKSLGTDLDTSNYWSKCSHCWSKHYDKWAQAMHSRNTHPGDP